jgi:hypothetical protein
VRRPSSPETEERLGNPAPRRAEGLLLQQENTMKLTEEQKSEGCILLLVGIVALPFQILIGVLWGGYVLSTLWGWFVAPLFNLPAITALQAASLALTVTFGAKILTVVKEVGKTKTLEEGVIAIIGSFFAIICGPALALLVGSIIKQFIP